jgi:hypothetical protein
MPAIAGTALAGSAQAAPAKTSIIEIGMAHMRNTHEDQPRRVADVWKNGFVPALQRAGAGPVGAFSSSIGPESPFMLTVTSYTSLAQYEEVHAKVSADAEFRKIYGAFEGLPGRTYERVENSLLRSFEGMPSIVPPENDGKRPSKVFEVRIYESNNMSSLARKVKMFNEGEIAIFQRLGMSPVFFGYTIVGTRMPNLVYMLSYKDMAHREECWTAFGGDPEWKKLREMPGYADADIVSNITNYIVSPLDFSPIR